MQPIPNVDLGGVLQIIDDTADPPRWKTVARLQTATRKHAKAKMRELGLSSAWILDGLGNRELIGE